MKIKENHKTFKSANDKSTMDVTPWLSTDYRTKNNGDEAYAGKIKFTIKEGSNNLSFYVDKSKAKLLFETIRLGKFEEVFGQAFIDYGSSNKAGQITARTFNIRLGSNTAGQSQFILKIEEGPGELIADRRTGAQNGAVKKIKTERQATKYISGQEGMIMAIETLDYIRDREMLGLMNGAPLVTLTTFEPLKPEMQEVQDSTNDSTDQARKQPTSQEVMELSTDELRAYIEEVRVENYPDLAFKKLIVDEVNRRKAEIKARKNAG